MKVKGSVMGCGEGLNLAWFPVRPTCKKKSSSRKQGSCSDDCSTMCEDS